MDRGAIESAVSVPFSDSEGLPRVPRPGRLRLRRVRFRTCPGSDLMLMVAEDVDGTLDAAHGVPRDAWWIVRCSNLPDRTMRLFQGSHSLTQLLQRYGFLDASGCIHHRDAIADFEPLSQPLPAVTLRIPPHLRDATGVPQFYRNSGNCWFAALCWTSFANLHMRELLLRHMPSDMHDMCKSCLHDRAKAEALRKRLWYDYAVGDNVEADPRMDGCNGFREFSVWCAKMGVPMIRYHEQGGHLVLLASEVADHKGKRVHIRPPRNSNEPYLLVLRYQNGDHHEKHPILRRVEHGSSRGRLIATWHGSAKCGHQIGMTSPSGDWRDWSVGDADQHKYGIGPTFMYFDEPRWRQHWWSGMREILYITKFGPGNRQFCNLSPHNERDDMLDTGRREADHVARQRHKPGQNNMDVVYYMTPHSRSSC